MEQHLIITDTDSPTKAGWCIQRLFVLSLVMMATTGPMPGRRAGTMQRHRKMDKTLLALVESKTDALGIWKKEPDYYKRALRAGAKVVSLPGKRPFFVYWLPPRFASQKEKMALVVLHGTNGNAYRHLLNFRTTAQKEGFALISIQWGWPEANAAGRGTEQRYMYLPADKLYTIMSLAIEYLARHHGINKNHCAWLGFSRSSTLCEAVAFYDKHRGNDYFRLYMAISGQVSPNYHMTQELASGRHGDRPIEGCHFYLWAGRRDGLRAEGMKRTEKIIRAAGGTVDILRIGPESHGGFNHSVNYQTEAVRLWKRLVRE